jgi:hypothetical protein
MTGICDKILALFRPLKLARAAIPESDRIMALLLLDKPAVFTAPTLVDGGRMVHLPMLVSEYDVNNYGHCVLSENQYGTLFSEYEKNQSQLNRTMVKPLSMPIYNNRRFFRDSEECPVIRTVPFVFEKKFFTEDQLAEYTIHWNRCQGMCNGLMKSLPRNFALFTLYKRAKEMTDSVVQMNSVFGLLSQKKVMKGYQKSLQRWQFMSISKFFVKTVRGLRFEKQKPLTSVVDGLGLLWKATRFQRPFFTPFLVQLLNKLPPPTSTPMQESFESTLSKQLTPPEDLAVIRSSRLYCQALRCIVYHRPPALGHRFFLFLDFLKKVDLIQKLFFPASYRKKIHIIALAFASSKNALLPETILFMDKLFFHSRYSNVIESRLKEKWCLLTQALWLIVADDQKLAEQCRDMNFG